MSNISKIKLLPDVVANQIAAGEVVLGPASVVKEMVENSVDAGAESVIVNYRDGGRELLQIIDDGEGMSPVDARLAFDKHATSKITSAEDIYRLHTFGFRGEALASIAAVARVELSTRREDDELGTEVVIEGSRFMESHPKACAKGSSFMVKNLFYNLPARRRALEAKSSSALSRALTDEFQRVALCHPEVAFSLYSNDSPLYNLPASNLKQRIVGVVGKRFAKDLLEVNTSTTIVKVEGFVGAPDGAVQKGAKQFLFVNGRYFRSPYLGKAIMQAYEKLIPAGSQPSWFLYLIVDTEEVDVNISPQKTEIHFLRGAEIWQIINAAVREALAKRGAVPMMDFDTSQEFYIPPVGGSERPRELVEPRSTLHTDYNPFSPRYSTPRVGSTASIADFDMPYEAGSESDEFSRFDSSTMEFIESGAEEQPALFEDKGYKGMLPMSGGYVATTLRGELAIVNLSRAREAILYKRYLQMLSSDSSVSQALLFPERVVLSSDDVTLAAEHFDDLSRFGFEFTAVDENTLEFSALPADVSVGELSDILYDIIDRLRDDVELSTTERRERMAAMLAGRGEAKELSEGEQLAILEAMEGGEGYSFTADGRAVVKIVGREELRTMFSR